MESAQEKLVSHCGTTVSEISYTGVDRRQFLQYAASVGATLGLSRSALGQMTAAQMDNRLPNGTEHIPWEQPLKFSKTYFVDNNSSKADDDGPGSSARPFRTINKAAQVLQPGERVVIAAGTYRECVRPVRGGTSPAQMISYEAAPGAEVVIKGSDVLKDGWQQESVAIGRVTPVTQVPAWQHELTAAMFPDAYNPFALASAPGDREWLDTKMVDMGPYFRRRGLVFVNGKPLEPMEQLRELAIAALPGPPSPNTSQPRNGLPSRIRTGPIMQEIGGTLNGRFWVDNSGTTVHVRLPEGTPADHLVEVTTREQVFVPLQKGLAFIRVKGITFQHAGNGYPIPQRGLVSTAGGNHWIIEGNTIEWANGVGLDIANGDWNARPTPQAGLNQIVRGNTIRYCGVEGIGGMGTVDAVIEDNLIEWCGWADAERSWEAAAVKFHRAHNMLFRRNVIRHIRHANAVWFDSGNVNNRITSNVFADVLTVSAAVHIEVNLEQNQMDNNIIWNVRNAEPGTPGQRGCAGSGVFINASNRLTLAQNLIGRCDNSGVFAIIREDRAGTGTATENKIYNNIFSSCGKSAILFLNQNNEADGNVYASMPKDFLGFTTHDEKQWLDLPAWRDEHGWDKHGATADLQIEFDPDLLQLTLNGSQLLPKVSAFNGIETDIFGKITGGFTFPGPLRDPGVKSVWKVDPRSTLT
jgi:hypothetical protein